MTHAARSASSRGEEGTNLVIHIGQQPCIVVTTYCSNQPPSATHLVGNSICSIHNATCIELSASCKCSIHGWNIPLWKYSNIGIDNTQVQWEFKILEKKDIWNVC